jgi:hypothetical protein
MPALRTTLTALVTALLLVAPQAARSQEKPPEPVDLTGKWTFTVTTSAGSGTPALTFVQKGDSLTGHYSSQALGEADFTGTVKDGKMRISVPVSVEGTSFTVIYEGTVESRDSMKGTVTLGDLGTGTFTAKREP